MVEGGFSRLHFDRYLVVEVGYLIGCQDFPHGIHVASQARLFQEAPMVAVGNIVHAPVLGIRVVQTHPAGQVGHGGRPSPV